MQSGVNIDGMREKTDARGDIVAEAYLAAVAFDSWSERITADRDCARLSGLRCRHLLV